MRKTLRFICPNCSKSFTREPRTIKKNSNFHYCSCDCKYAHRLKIILKKAAKPFGKSWDELIYQWYVVEKIPVRQITAKLKISNRLVPKALRLLKIPQRSIHERIALQWKNNPERREWSREIARKNFTGKPSWNKGLTKKDHPSIKKVAEAKIGSKNPMYGKFGKLSPRYKNGKYTAEKKRFWSTSEYQQWREAVYERDDYMCQMCGDNRGGNLNAHHIKSFVDYPELRYDVSNGITFCKPCHQFVHSSKYPEIEQRHLEWAGG